MYGMMYIYVCQWVRDVSKECVLPKLPFVSEEVYLWRESPLIRSPGKRRRFVYNILWPI